MPRLFLVDDSETNRLTLSALLEDEGFVIDEASSFTEARARLEAAAGFDVVLLDQHLGDGLGADLLPIVRGACPSAKIVMMSGSLFGDAQFPGGLDGRFEKGGSFERLLEIIRGLLT